MANRTALDLAKSFGYLTNDEVRLLHFIAYLTPWDGVVVNIGAGAGTSGLAFAEVLPKADRYTVDISPGGPLGGLDGEYNAYDDKTLVPHQILGDSKLVGKQWDKKRKIDLLFIDGDHSLDGIVGDLDAWMFHVKRNGIIAFHDYGAEKWPAVKKTVDLLMSDYGVVAWAGNIKAFRIWSKEIEEAEAE